MSRAGYNFCIIECYGKKVSIIWFFFEKYTFFACLFGSGLNCIFHWKAQLLIICRSLLNSLCDLYLSKAYEKRDVSSAKNLQVDWMLSGKSLIYRNRNKRGPSTEACGTPGIYQLPRRDLTIKNNSFIVLVNRFIAHLLPYCSNSSFVCCISFIWFWQIVTCCWRTETVHSISSFFSVHFWMLLQLHFLILA